MKRLVAGIVGVGVFVVVVAGGGRAVATVHGQNGRVAFRQFLNDDHTRGDIFTVAPNGTGVRRVTHTGGGVGTEPDWSPDGRWIAYMIAPDGDQDHARLAKIHPSGTAMTPLSQTCTGWCRSDGFPAWSPWGRGIAFERALGPAPEQENLVAIYVIRADGTRARRITHRGVSAAHPRRYIDLAPTWAPSGHTLAFERQDNKTGHHAVFTVGLDGKRLRRITPWHLDASQPDYSPNGRWILFRSDEPSDTSGNVWLVRPDGTGLHAVTHSPAGVAKWASGSFSPDGRHITDAKIPIVGGEQTHADVFTMDLDGRHMRNITKTPNLWESAPDWGPRPR